MASSSFLPPGCCTAAVPPVSTTAALTRTSSAAAAVGGMGRPPPRRRGVQPNGGLDQSSGPLFDFALGQRASGCWRGDECGRGRGRGRGAGRDVRGVRSWAQGKNGAPGWGIPPFTSGERDDGFQNDGFLQGKMEEEAWDEQWGSGDATVRSPVRGGGGGPSSAFPRDGLRDDGSSGRDVDSSMEGGAGVSGRGPQNNGGDWSGNPSGKPSALNLSASPPRTSSWPPNLQNATYDGRLSSSYAQDSAPASPWPEEPRSMRSADRPSDQSSSVSPPPSRRGVEDSTASQSKPAWAAVLGRGRGKSDDSWQEGSTAGQTWREEDSGLDGGGGRAEWSASGRAGGGSMNSRSSSSSRNGGTESERIWTDRNVDRNGNGNGWRPNSSPNDSTSSDPTAPWQQQQQQEQQRRQEQPAAAEPSPAVSGWETMPGGSTMPAAVSALPQQQGISQQQPQPPLRQMQTPPQQSPPAQQQVQLPQQQEPLQQQQKQVPQQVQQPVYSPGAWGSEVAECMEQGMALLAEGRAGLQGKIEIGLAESFLSEASAQFDRAFQLDSSCLPALGQSGNALLALGELKLKTARQLRAELTPEPVPPRPFGVMGGDGRMVDPYTLQDPRAAAVAAAEEYEMLRAQRADELALIDRLGDECEQALVEAGRKYRAALSMDNRDARALYNWGLALCYRAQLVADEADERYEELADKMLRAAMDKFEAMMSLTDKWRIGALQNYALALRDRARLRPIRSQERLRLTRESWQYLADALRLDPSNPALKAALTACNIELKKLEQMAAARTQEAQQQLQLQQQRQQLLKQQQQQQQQAPPLLPPRVQGWDEMRRPPPPVPGQEQLGQQQQEWQQQQQREGQGRDGFWKEAAPWLDPRSDGNSSGGW